ncbi:hypothetical protein DR63_959 [Burkholderia thailandensis E264]|nr:hypothetical protein DR63_959 [Burkholderia thailandensis E264]
MTLVGRTADPITPTVRFPASSDRFSTRHI